MAALEVGHVEHEERDKLPLDMNVINHAMTFTPSERCTISCGTVCVDPRTSRVLIIFNRRLGIWQLPKGRKNIGEDLHAAALRETYEETGVHAALLPLKIRTRSTNPFAADSFASGAGSKTQDAALHRSTLSTASASSASTACSASVASTSSSAFTSLTAPVGTGSSPPVNEKEDLSQKELALQTIRNEKSTTDDSENHGSRARHLEIGPSNGTASVDALDDLVGGVATADPKVTTDIFNNELVGIVQYPDLQASTPETLKTVFFFAALADSSAPMGPGAQEEHEDLRAEWVNIQVAKQLLRFEPESEVVCKVEQDMKRSGINC